MLNQEVSLLGFPFEGGRRRRGIGFPFEGSRRRRGLGFPFEGGRPAGWRSGMGFPFEGSSLLAGGGCAAWCDAEGPEFNYDYCFDGNMCCGSSTGCSMPPSRDDLDPAIWCELTGDCGGTTTTTTDTSPSGPSWYCTVFSIGCPKGTKGIIDTSATVTPAATGALCSLWSGFCPKIPTPGVAPPAPEWYQSTGGMIAIGFGVVATGALLYAVLT